MSYNKFYRAVAIASMLVSAPAATRAQSSSVKPTIVLVHGAFADALGWQHVIPLLEKKGYNVIAVENPLSSLADDIATTKRVIDNQKGPVVVVGHSYGGVVITGAAAGNAHVKALVYIAAFAPEANEPVGPLTDKYPSSLGAALRPDAAGYLWVDQKMFHDVFAADASLAEAKVMAASQKPVNKSVFAATIRTPAWKTIPSWYIVARNDRALNPELERFYARRAKAKTIEINSSHAAFVSHPQAVADVILQAAAAAGK